MNEDTYVCIVRGLIIFIGSRYVNWKLLCIWKKKKDAGTMINVLPRVCYLCVGKINIDEFIDMHISNTLMENDGKK